MGKTKGIPMPMQKLQHLIEGYENEGWYQVRLQVWPKGFRLLGFKEDRIGANVKEIEWFDQWGKLLSHLRSHQGASTTVIHVDEMVKGDVYIGRAVTARGLEAHFLASGFRIGKDGNRAEVLVLYKDWFMKQLERENFRGYVEELRGKKIACWCKTKEKPKTACHGDIIVAYLEGDYDE